MTHKITDIVSFISVEFLAETGPTELLAKLKARFPVITVGECRYALKAWHDAQQAAHDEAILKLEAEKVQIDLSAELGERFPQAATLGEAVEIGVACDDPIALAFHAVWSTDEYRVREALELAALRAHPRWTEGEEGNFKWTGDGDMPTGDALIEWFQMTHPAKAHEIERDIEGGSRFKPAKPEGA